MNKIQEIRDLPDDGLIERLESLKEELFNLRFQLATGQLDNPMRIKDVRHEVARILTVLRERHIDRELDDIEAAISATPSDEESAEHAEEVLAEHEASRTTEPGRTTEAIDVSDEEGSRSEAVAPEGGVAKRSRLRREKKKDTA
jgi:large subunit ribosomal protein L29